MVIDAGDYTIKLANSAASSCVVEKALTCYTLSHKRDKPCEGTEHACPLEQVRKTKKPVTLEHIHYNQEGNPRNIEVIGYPIFDDQGNIIQMIEYNFDITERKQAQEALRESEALLSKAQEIGHFGSWDLNLSTNLLTWSDEVYRIFGLKPQEFAGTYEAFLDAVHPEDRAAVDAAYSGSLKEGKDSYEIEHRVVRRNTGETRYVHERCENVKDASGRVVRSIGRVHDITERKQAEEKVRALNVELQDRLKELLEAKALEEKANRAKAEFLANISHELTTPLNSIIGFSQVLLTKNFGDLNEKQRGYVENILNAGERLHDTLKNIVSFVRMDVSDPEMDWQEFRLKDIVDSSLSVFRKAATDRHLTLTLDMATEADRMIRADRGKLAQVFHSLILNAMKFSREGGQITLGVRYRKGSGESGKDDFIEITVEDTGIGIKEEDMPLLFRPFHQLEAPLTKLFAGVGMGLVLARKLIEAHGGAIRVESDYGKGSKFIFTIPVNDGQKNDQKGSQP